MTAVPSQLPAFAASPAPATNGNGTAHGKNGLPPKLEALQLSKRFGALQALLDVSLTLHPGSFRALLGENGAGKSTLVKCIMGTYRADAGRVHVGAHDVEVKSPRQAHALGLGMVYQHFTLVENMTVVENILMARGHIPAVVNWKAETEQLAAFMEKMPFRVNPTSYVRDLSAGEKQKVELLKQELGRKRIDVVPAHQADRPRATAVMASFGEVVDGRADAVSIQLPPGANGLDRVVRALDEAGVAVEDIALRAPTLDDVFLAKTGRTLEGAASTSGEVAA